MVAEPAPNPDITAEHIRHITRRWHELGRDCMFEVRMLTDEDKASVKDVSRYMPTEDGIRQAAEHVAAMGQYNLNGYIVVNPINATAHIKAGDAAKDADILASFFHWADADDAAAANNIREFVGPKPTFFVLTGTTPSPRPHVYWELEEPTLNLDAWRETQKAIAATLKTDASVVNPSRIMRLAGTVNWPKPSKKAKGYVREVTSLVIHSEDDRPRVEAERMRRAFGTKPSQPAPGEGFSIDVGHKGKSVDELMALVRGASTDGQKHASVRDLAGHLAGTGVKRETCEAIIRTVCPVWDRNVESLINNAYQWASAQGIGSSPEALEKDQTGAVTGLKILSSREFLSDLEPAVYVVDGVLAKKRCLSITGYAGHGKTTLALHLAIQVATGGEFGGAECEKGSVLILAGENPDNVKWQYAAAVAAAGKGEDLPVYFLPGHFQLSAFLDDLLEKARAIPDLKLVVIDSLQAFFEGDSDNGNVEMIEAARRFRALSEIESGPAVMVIAHPAGKRPDKGNIVPRGGSAFGNEFDGNLTVWAEPDGTQTFHHTEKFRGSPFEPMHFVMEDKEFDHLKDHKGRNMRLKVSRQQLLIEQANAATRSERRERDALAVLDADPRVSIRALAERLVVSKSTADRIMQNLKDEKLIRRHAKKWLLTDGGKEVLDGE